MTTITNETGHIPRLIFACMGDGLMVAQNHNHYKKVFYGNISSRNNGPGRDA